MLRRLLTRASLHFTSRIKAGFFCSRALTKHFDYAVLTYGQLLGRISFRLLSGIRGCQPLLGNRQRGSLALPVIWTQSKQPLTVLVDSHMCHSYLSSALTRPLCLSFPLSFFSLSRLDGWMDARTDPRIPRLSFFGKTKKKQPKNTMQPTSEPSFLERPR